MHGSGIKAQIKSKYKPQTTKADLDAKAYGRLLDQNFDVQESNAVCIADLTYVRVSGKWCYMAGVLDLARRKLIGWSIGTRPTAKLACQALTMAIQREKPQSGLIHHSDRSSQYTSQEYKKLLETNKMLGSMSRKADPYDNAPMESFFRLLKVEHVYKRSFATIAQAAYSLKKWFDYYNIRRLLSALGGISPLMCEIRRNHPFGLSA